MIFKMNNRNIVQIFAENIMALRKKKGFSQYDLAQLTGISRRMICHYETEGMIPPGDRLQALANALDVPVAKLFEEKNIVLNDPVDLTNIDSRSVKKLKDILSLPPEDRNDLYRILNKLVRKNQLEKQQKTP